MLITEEEENYMNSNTHHVKSYNVKNGQYKRALYQLSPHYSGFQQFVSASEELSCEGEKLYDVDTAKDPRRRNAKSSLYLELPYPVSCPLRMKLHQADPCTQLILDKNKYLSNFDTCKKEFRKDRKRLKKQLRTYQNGINVPGYLLDLEDDPDQFFSGNYNWYRIGGSLDSVVFNGQVYLVRTYLENDLWLTNLSDPRKQFFIKEYTQEPIYNVKAVEYDEGFFVLTRCKHEISIKYWTEDNENLKRYPLWTESSTISPYIDFKLNTANYSIGSLDVLHTLKITDLNYGQILYINNPVNSTYCFSQFDFIGTDSILFMDPSSLWIMDIRSGLTKSAKINSQHFLYEDALCTFTISKQNSNVIFLSSNHSIMQIDLRQFQLIDKYTHMLTTPPLMSKTCLNGGDEYVYLASQHYSDKSLLRVSPSGYNEPLLTPNIMHTLQEVNLTRSYILNENLTDRLKLSTAGVEILHNESNEIALYSSTSVGDLFKQSVGHVEFDSEMALDHLVNWVHSLPHIEKLVEATSFHNFNKVMSCILTEQPQNNKKELADHTLLHNKQYIADNMTVEEDAFANRLIIWEDKEIFEDTNGILPPSLPSNHKVTEWLQAHPSRIDDVTEDIGVYDNDFFNDEVKIKNL